MRAKILVVDADPQVTHLLDLILSREGYQIELASTARQGLWQAYAFQPDVVLLDILLPDMDGWQALTALRTFSDVPVIMVTVLTSTESLVRSLDAGADDVVTKPFKADELKARIRAVLRRAVFQAARGQRRHWLAGSGWGHDLLARLEGVSEAAVRLTPTEYVLLHTLALGTGIPRGSNPVLESVFPRTGSGVSMN